MTRALHISDPHFGTQQQPVLDALRALVAHHDPEVVLLGGDITQRARGWQFKAARRFMDSLGKPFVAVPGNHDIPLYNLVARLFDPYGNYRRSFGANREPVYESESLLVIGVDTTRRYRHKHGELSARQVDRVARRLREARSKQLRVVMLHHPLVAAVESDQTNLARGREAAMRAWVDAGADILLGGHIHLPYVMPLPAWLSGTGTWAVQAGTAVSHRVRGGVPNSVNVLDWRPDLPGRICRLERWDFLAAAGEFVPAAQHELVLAQAIHSASPSHPAVPHLALGR